MIRAMTKRRIFLALALSAAALTTLIPTHSDAAADRKPKISLRFHLEAKAIDTEKFSTPITLEYARREAFISKIPVISEMDVQRIHPYTADDGTYGCVFYLDNHGKLALDTLSIQHRKEALVVFLNGRQVMDMLIDRRISDGVITIPFGLAGAEVEALQKAFKPMVPAVPAE